MATVLGCLIIATVVLSSLSSFFKASFGGSDEDDSGTKTQKGKAKTSGGASTRLMIVGPPNSGKTALLYYIYTGEFRPTVSSINENLSAEQAEVLRHLGNKEAEEKCVVLKEMNKAARKRV